MAGELSQRELEELVVGKPQKPTVLFYDRALLDVTASKEANRRIYRTLTFINEKQAGVTDWVAESAKPHHIKNYPVEYALYKAGQKDNSPSIDIIPNISPSELQELLDFRLGTIERLAEAETVPPHLLHVQISAKVLQSVLTEQKNGKEETHNEETRPVIEGGNPTSEAVDSARAVSPINRLNDSNDVERCLVPKGITSIEGSVAEEPQASRRIDSNSGKLSSNWSIAL